MRGLSSDQQFTQIRDGIRTLTDSTFVQSSGVARATQGFEATVTLKTTANKTKALAILNSLTPKISPGIQVDDAFLGITTLVCPKTTSYEAPIESVCFTHYVSSQAG